MDNGTQYFFTDKLLLTESLQLVDSLEKAHDEEVQKINPIKIAEKKERD